MKKSILFLLFTLPLFAFAESYQGEAGTAQMAGDFFTDFWDLMTNDVPSVAQRFWAWIVIKAVEIKLYITLETIKFSWGVAKAILENFQVASRITAQINNLSPDIRQFFIDTKFVDALMVVINAHATRYVMRFLG